MKSRTLKFAVSITLLAVLLTPLRLAAQDKQDDNNKHHHYKLIDMGTLGGPNGYFEFTSRAINNPGLATSFSDTAIPVNPPWCFNDCYLAHAAVWRDGIMTDLGGLPGVSVPGSGPNDINAKGVVVGIAFTGGVYQPLGLPEFDAVVWKNDKIIDLGTFGGTFSYASAINSRDQVVGFALNTTPDDFLIVTRHILPGRAGIPVDGPRRSL